MATKKSSTPANDAGARTKIARLAALQISDLFCAIRHQARDGNGGSADFEPTLLRAIAIRGDDLAGVVLAVVGDDTAAKTEELERMVSHG